MANLYTPNTKGMYACPECGKEFESPQAVGVHRRHEHGHKAKRKVKTGTRKSKAGNRTLHKAVAVALTDERLGLTAAILTLPEVRTASREQLVDVFEVILRQMAGTNGRG